MTIPVTNLHILRLMLQIEQNLSGLQRDIRNNAITWKAMAQAQTVPIATLATYLNEAAIAYQSRISWLSEMQADGANWPKLGAMWAMLGGTSEDFSNMTTPINAVANQLGPAAKATYAQVIGICDQITSAVNAPLSLWPE